MMTWIWVNISAGNGLVPDSIKLLPKPMLTYHWWSSMVLNNSLEVLKMICKMGLKKYTGKISSTSPRGQWVKPYNVFPVIYCFMMHWSGLTSKQGWISYVDLHYTVYSMKYWHSFVVLYVVVLVISVLNGITWCIHLYCSGLLHWHWSNHVIAPVPVKQPWEI